MDRVAERVLLDFVTYVETTVLLSLHTQSSITIPIYSTMSQIVAPGGQIILDDGQIGFRVLRVEANGDVICTIENGGILGNNKSRYSGFSHLSH